MLLPPVATRNSNLAKPARPTRSRSHALGRIAISLGDPAGIGPEIVLKALAARPSLNDRCTVFGSASVLAATAESLGLPLPQHVEAITHLSNEPIETGVESKASGAQAYAAITAATGQVLAGQAAALVTAPISKRALNLAGHHWPGHTELLAELAGGCPVRMMLANPTLRVVLVTVHQPLREALAAITVDRILQTLQITDRSLRPALGRQPRLWVAGLNPHAGEGGLLGREEIDLIGPAVEAARGQGLDVEGPAPPDTVFMRARGLKACDAVIAMYHDQGLIPVKYLGVDDGVNVTLGLPFVRASPDHGTAFDIAGRGIARPDSLLAAIRLAGQWSRLARPD